MSDHRDSIKLGLLQAMQAIEAQIARAMQRTPAQRELHGVQKWQPYNERIERISAQILDAINDAEAGLDSVLVLAQSLVKALTLIVDDMGAEGLGDLRAEYCRAALDAIARDADRGAELLKGGQLVS